MIKELQKIKKAMLKDMRLATIAIMKQRDVKGNSDLIKSIAWIEKDNVFLLVANDYFDWVDTGRRKGIMPPPQDLIPWMKKSGISPRGKMSYNQLAFIIANGIKKNGIKGKLYTTPIVDVNLDIVSETLAETLSTAIVNELATSLENK